MPGFEPSISVRVRADLTKPAGGKGDHRASRRCVSTRFVLRLRPRVHHDRSVRELDLNCVSRMEQVAMPRRLPGPRLLLRYRPRSVQPRRSRDGSTYCPTDGLETVA